MYVEDLESFLFKHFLWTGTIWVKLIELNKSYCLTLMSSFHRSYFLSTNLLLDFYKTVLSIIKITNVIFITQFILQWTSAYLWFSIHRITYLHNSSVKFDSQLFTESPSIHRFFCRAHLEYLGRKMHLGKLEHFGTMLPDTLFAGIYKVTNSEEQFLHPLLLIDCIHKSEKKFSQCIIMNIKV